MPQGLVVSPIHFYDFSGGKVRVGTSNYLSQVKRDERDDAPSPVSTLSSNKPLVLSRLSVVPGESGVVVCAVPLWEERTGTAVAAADRIVGANLVKLTATGPMPITVGRYWDLDPFVTREWIYFSSDRTRVRIIWRVPLSGKGGYSPLTGTLTKFDTEPAVAPDAGFMADARLGRRTERARYLDAAWRRPEPGCLRQLQSRPARR